MGLKFCNEAIIALQQIWPKIETEKPRFELTPLQVSWVRVGCDSRWLAGSFWRNQTKSIIEMKLGFRKWLLSRKTAFWLAFKLLRSKQFGNRLGVDKFRPLSNARWHLRPPLGVSYLKHSAVLELFPLKYCRRFFGEITQKFIRAPSHQLISKSKSTQPANISRTLTSRPGLITNS